MQTSNLLHFIVAAVLLAGAGLYSAIDGAIDTGTARWPESNSIYFAQRWIAGPQSVQLTGSTASMTREFRSPSGATAMLTILASRVPKLSGPGPEVPFLGSGYTVETGPAVVDVDRNDGIHPLVADRGAERWLVVYAYGEDRGLMGNGPLPWTFAVNRRHPRKNERLFTGCI
jgi:hypothetical protein